MARLAVLTDYPEEAWPSMDLCAEMLLTRLRSEHADQLHTTQLCPPFRRRLGRLPLLRAQRWGLNADRLLNRFRDYPRYLRQRAHEFDIFSICDHSYAQLAHELPGERTGVYCHDLDTFRCLLQPTVERRPFWFRKMMARVLKGLQKAAVVFYSTQAVRAQIEQHGLLPADRLVFAPYGTSPEFTPEPSDASQIVAPTPGLDGRPFLLHVGSCIPRKRIDVLLDVFAGVQARHPGFRLVQIGGPWTAAQRDQIGRLGLTDAVLQFRGLDRHALAALYRRATLVLQPSEAEGFGLPVIEALSCGSIVVASDIPVLREVGGAAVLYCPVANVAAWVDTACQLIEHPATAPERSARLAHAGRYSWSAQANTIVTAYERLLGLG